MEVIIERVAGLDIHKKSITACVRTPDGSGGRSEQVRTFSAFLAGLEALRAWLLEEGVTHVAMEATSSYWLPVWRVLEDPVDADGPAVGAPFVLLLCNARHVKHVPGRKTDVADAVWLAQLLECGLLSSSFVPPADIRGLREATRYRKRLIETRTSEIQRIEKTLDDAICKLSTVASSTLTKSGRNMIEALIDGERDPEVLAEMAYGRMRPKIPQLIRALDSRFAQQHAIQLRQLFDHIDWLDGAISTLDARIVVLTADRADMIGRLQTVPGIGLRTAQVIVAETGGDMSRFPTAAHLASWAGLCPGQNESGGKRRSGRTRHGDQWLADALVQAAWAAARSTDTSLAAKFRRVTGPGRDGQRRKKAVVAVAHKLLVISYAIMASPNEVYRELGGDYLARHDNPERRKTRLVAQLGKLGYEVELTPVAAA